MRQGVCRNWIIPRAPHAPNTLPYMRISYFSSRTTSVSPRFLDGLSVATFFATAAFVLATGEGRAGIRDIPYSDAIQIDGNASDWAGVGFEVGIVDRIKRNVPPRRG